jgi:hypothetical protein
MARVYTVSKDAVIQVSHYGAATHELGCEVSDSVGRELIAHPHLRVEFDAQQKPKKPESAEAVVIEPTAKPEEKRAK